MEQHLLSEIKEAIHRQYQIVRGLILSPQSYNQKDIETDHLKQYIAFLERALQQPYNRMMHLHTFLNDPDGLMSARMYPFCFLSPKVKNHILSSHQQIEVLINCFDLLSKDEGLLVHEPHERAA